MLTTRVPRTCHKITNNPRQRSQEEASFAAALKESAVTRFSSRLAVAGLAIVAALAIARPAQADEPVAKPRVKLVMASAERVLSDLEWIIAELALEKGQWEQNIFPSLDIFLVGVDRDKPIRFDVQIGGEEDESTTPKGYRFQPGIPVDRNGKGIRDFIKNNLEPLDIKVQQRSRRGDYFKLAGVYEGWMRMVDEYACIGTYESDVPKGMPHPSESHDELVEKGFDIALELDNDADQTDQRKEAMAAFEANILDATKEKEGESDAAFALRKAKLSHDLETFGGMFEDAKRITIGWTTDTDKESGRADLYGEGLPDTGLANFIDMIAVEHSTFAALAIPEDPAASLHMNVPYDDMRKRHLAELYELTLPVLHEKIDGSDGMASSEKEPAKQAVTLLFEMLTAGIELGKLDLFFDMTKTEAGPHVAIFGVHSADGKKADEIVKLIPKAHEAWTVEMDVESVSETAIHKIDISEDLPVALTETFGESGLVYVATSEKLVWICGGGGSLELLKESIAQVSDFEMPSEVSPVFGEFKVHAHTLLKLYDSLVVEMGWNPLGKIEVEAKGPAAGDGDSLQLIDPAELRDIATRATANIDDRVSGQARRIGDHAEGEILVEPGLMRAVGKIIAKIAADNL